ncbi:hypothetical protein DEJ13_17415 [Curtobacterium sp. MCLR17_007]|uniref:hypothetical protein n=1 Tax=Curtobacterium sp. MCLR17_007 TaxID=2175648 RepID=UPI000DA8338E|nr:hypothetical protein [Curtobacterium sp. MCLR17_007]WIB60194.1 hypothetical protein DEJ13_17415 [Curtobacterium sp. MCLR17_007]
MVILLGVVAAALWVVAVALPILVLVLIGGLPGDDPAHTQRSLVIASGAFVTVALLAIAATIGFVVLRRAQDRDHDS